MRSADPVLRAAWLAQPAYLVGEVLVGVLAGVAYSFRDDTISELGAVCPATEASGCSSAPLVMNTLFVVFGVLQVVGAVSLLRCGSPGSHRAVGALWAVAGISAVLVGFLSVDDHPRAHTLVALPVFVAQPLTMLLHARLMPKGPVRTAGLLLGVVAVVGAVTFAALLGSPTWEGAVERVAIWPAKVWLSLAALAMTPPAQRSPLTRRAA